MSDSLPWTAAHQASLSITNSWSLLKLMSTDSVMPCNHLVFCHPPLLLPSIFPSMRSFSNESVLHIRWPKYSSFSISLSSEYSGLISFRMDWFDLLTVQGIYFEVKVKVTQSCPTLCNPTDCTVYGILWARILECVGFPFSRRSSQPRDQTQISCTAGGFFTI